MQATTDMLAHTLNLTQYQADVLRAGRDKYDVARLVKRGPILYAPHRTRGVFQSAARILMGRRADLIGKNKILVHGQRGIKFYAGGFHCVRIGRFMYYADASGAAISRKVFDKALKESAR